MDGIFVEYERNSQRVLRAHVSTGRQMNEGFISITTRTTQAIGKSCCFLRGSQETTGLWRAHVNNQAACSIHRSPSGLVRETSRDHLTMPHFLMPPSQGHLYVQIDTHTHTHTLAGIHAKVISCSGTWRNNYKCCSTPCFRTQARDRRVSNSLERTGLCKMLSGDLSMSFQHCLLALSASV